MTRTHFEELKVYQLAETLADEIWVVVAKWEYFAQSTVGQQIVRSADGVGACLAEGSGRGTAQDNRRFIGMARESLYETKHWLRRAFKRKLLTKPRTDELKGIMDYLTPALNGYWRFVSQAAARSRAKTKSKL